MKKSTLISLLLGFVAATLVAATTEQIWQNIYNSSSNAIQVTVVGGSGTPIAIGTPLPTSTPLAFGTPGVLAVFAATELGAYPGAACTPPALALSQSAAGAWTCATPVPPTITNLTYTGLLNIGDVHASSSGVTIAHRIEACTAGSSADQTYTMPASPTIGDTYTLIKVDSGTKACIFGRAGSQVFNTTATTRTLSTQGTGDTCIYISSNYWFCQGSGT